MADKTFYWLKMGRNFMKKHSIKILRKQPDGPEMVNFFLCLLLESIDHFGELRYSEELPFSNEDLAIVTETDLEIVDKAMEYFLRKKLIEILDDGTIVIPMAEEMIGKESASAERVRQHRERQKPLENTECNADVTQMKRECNKNVTQSKSKSKSKSIDVEEEVKEEESTAASASAPIQELHPGKIQEICDLWNRQEITQKIKSIPFGKRMDNTRLCLHLAGSYEDLLRVINDLDNQGWFRDQAKTGKHLKYDWFCDPNNFQKIIEGNYRESYSSKETEGMVWV